MNSTRNKFFIRINDTDYNLNSGFQLEEILSEDLDSAKLSIAHTEKMELNPLDKVVLYESDYLELSIIWKKNYLLSDFIEEQINYGDTILYNYSITLTSPTLLLENHIRPNLTITKQYDGDNLLLDYLNKILEANKTYQQELKEELGSEKVLELSDNLKTRLEGVEVLETQLPNMNLREIFNELLEPSGLVVKMDDYNTIDYLDLNSKGNEIDTTKLVNDTLKQNSSEYASHLKMQAENCLGDTTNCVEQYVGIRSNDYLVTTDNVVIPTKNAIYDIDKVYCIVDIDQFLVYYNLYYNIGDDEYAYQQTEVYSGKVKLDITEFICTKEIYDTLLDDSSYSSQYGYGGETFNDDFFDKYKINHLYFTQNQNDINGLSFSYTKLFSTSDYAYQQIFKIAFIKYLYENEIQKILDDANATSDTYTKITIAGFKEPKISDVRDLIFDIYYKTSQNLNLEFEKTNSYANTRKLVDGQQASFLDNTRLGKSMQEKINRIGNKTRTINARYSKYSEVPKLNDYIDSYILVKRRLIFYPNEILFEGILNKDFSMKNLATSLSQRKRWTSIDTSNNVLLRNENIRIVCDVSTSSTDFASRYWNTFIAYLFEKYGKNGLDLLWVLKTIDENNIEYGLFKITPSIQKIGNFVAIAFTSSDNYSIGTQVSSKDATGGYAQAKTRYVNDYGEFNTFKLSLYTGHTYDLSNDSDVSKMNLEAQFSPIIDSSLISGLEEVWNMKKQYNKDNREILAFTLQLEFRGGENVIVKDEFLDYLPLLLKEDTEDILPLQLYVNEDDLFAEDDKIARGENLANVPGTAVLISNNRIEVNSDLLGFAKSWCIATKYGKKILIAVNSSINVINFNFDLNI